MRVVARTPFEKRFDLEAGEGQTVLDLLGAALGAAEDERIARLVAAIGTDRPPAEGLGLPRGSSEVLYARATQWFAVGRPDRAEPLFRMLCLLEGSVADHWVGHGVCLHLAEQTAAAGLAFRTAQTLRPEWAVPYFHLAAVAVRDRRWAEARTWLGRFRGAVDASVPETMQREAARLEVMARSGDDP